MTVVAHATCLGCGCTCDDIDIVVEGERIVEARNACPLGVAWFGNGSAPASARVGVRRASVDEALDEAARLLLQAERPLVYLAPGISCETQREGVAVADLLRALLDSVTSSTSLATLLASQERGFASATLGEIRNRSDVIVFWGVDPADRYPRYGPRYAPEPEGIHVPHGRASRTVVGVTVGSAVAPADADVHVTMSPSEEVATLVALRALVSAPGSGSAGDDASHAAPWRHARELAAVLLRGRYVALVHDVEPSLHTTLEGSIERTDALIALAQALNGSSRCALSPLRAGGNRSGADAVITWQTGFPAAVDFVRGVPRYDPHEAPARLARGAIDASLVLGAPALIPARPLAALEATPCAVIGPGATASTLGIAGLAIDTATAGIHEGGTAVRMDDVPLPLRACLPGPPAAADVARALRERIQRSRGARRA